jgi:hypothetical protein
MASRGAGAGLEGLEGLDGGALVRLPDPFGPLPLEDEGRRRRRGGPVQGAGSTTSGEIGAYWQRKDGGEGAARAGDGASAREASRGPEAMSLTPIRSAGSRGSGVPRAGRRLLRPGHEHEMQRIFGAAPGAADAAPPLSAPSLPRVAVPPRSAALEPSGAGAWAAEASAPPWERKEDEARPGSATELSAVLRGAGEVAAREQAALRGRLEALERAVSAVAEAAGAGAGAARGAGEASHQVAQLAGHVAALQQDVRGCRDELVRVRGEEDRVLERVEAQVAALRHEVLLARESAAQTAAAAAAEAGGVHRQLAALAADRATWARAEDVEARLRQVLRSLLEREQRRQDEAVAAAAEAARSALLGEDLRVLVAREVQEAVAVAVAGLGDSARASDEQLRAMVAREVQEAVARSDEQLRAMVAREVQEALEGGWLDERRAAEVRSVARSEVARAGDEWRRDVERSVADRVDAAVRDQAGARMRASAAAEPSSTAAAALDVAEETLRRLGAVEQSSRAAEQRVEAALRGLAAERAHASDAPASAAAAEARVALLERAVARLIENGDETRRRLADVEAHAEAQTRAEQDKALALQYPPVDALATNGSPSLGAATSSLRSRVGSLPPALDTGAQRTATVVRMELELAADDERSRRGRGGARRADEGEGEGEEEEEEEEEAFGQLPGRGKPPAPVAKTPGWFPPTPADAPGRARFRDASPRETDGDAHRASLESFQNAVREDLSDVRDEVARLRAQLEALVAADPGDGRRGAATGGAGADHQDDDHDDVEEGSRADPLLQELDSILSSADPAPAPLRVSAGGGGGASAATATTARGGPVASSVLARVRAMLDAQSDAAAEARAVLEDACNARSLAAERAAHEAERRSQQAVHEALLQVRATLARVEDIAFRWVPWTLSAKADELHLVLQSSARHVEELVRNEARQRILTERKLGDAILRALLAARQDIRAAVQQHRRPRDPTT